MELFTPSLPLQTTSKQTKYWWRRDLLKTNGGLTKKGRTTQLRSRRKKPIEISLASGVLPGPSASPGTQLGEPLCALERQEDKNQSPRLT